VIVDNAGYVYGTTLGGGNGPCQQGCGTVFRLVPPKHAGGKWVHQLLYEFQGGSDGIQPEAPLTLDSKHNLYGSTISDGTGVCFPGTGPGCGTIFELSPPPILGDQWSETILYKFLGGDDGIEPTDRLVFDRNGNLFGTTEIGGTFSGCNGAGCGTVFKLTPPGQPGSPWTETVLYRFSGGDDGFVPRESSSAVEDCSTERLSLVAVPRRVWAQAVAWCSVQCHKSYETGPTSSRDG